MQWTKVLANTTNESYKMVDIGFAYQKGIGVNRNYDTALFWYRKSAELNNANGMFNIGLCYHEAWGVPRNYDSSLKWYLKAAELGHEIAMRNIGGMYKVGHSVEKITP